MSNLNVSVCLSLPGVLLLCTAFFNHSAVVERLLTLGADVNGGCSSAYSFCMEWGWVSGLVGFPLNNCAFSTCSGFGSRREPTACGFAAWVCGGGGNLSDVQTSHSVRDCHSLLCILVSSHLGGCGLTRAGTVALPGRHRMRMDDSRPLDIDMVNTNGETSLMTACCRVCGGGENLLTGALQPATCVSCDLCVGWGQPCL